LASVLIPLDISDAINSNVIYQLLKGMEITQTRQSTLIPTWDLGIINVEVKPFEHLGLLFSRNLLIRQASY
jgi:uncharacterized membrane protein YvlD (DUF360 family)